MTGVVDQGKLGLMAHKIFTGSFAALETRWFDQVSALQADDTSATVAVLVGSNLLAAYLKNRLAERGRAVANLRFFTFVDLARLITEAAKSLRRKARLPRLGASAILDHLLDSDPTPAFAGVAALTGFRAAVLDTFRDLRDADIGPLEFERGVRRCLDAGSDRREHLAGMSGLYQRFRRIVSLFAGVDDDFRAATESAQLAPAALGTERLLVYGIYDVTGQQSDLLTRLKDFLELVYFVPWVDENVSAFALPFIDARSRELGTSVESLPESEAVNRLGKLRGLDFGFRPGSGGSPAADKLPSSGSADDHSFSLVSAPGESRAAVETIREILAAVRDGTIRGLHEAVVIMRHPDDQAPVLTEALRLRNIPYFLEGGCRLIDRPLGRAVKAVADLESSSFSRQAILTAMELVAAALPETPSHWEVQQWHVLTNHPRFLSGTGSWDGGTDALVRETERDLKAAQSASDDDAEDRDRRRISPAAAARRHASALALKTAWNDVKRSAAGWPETLSWREWSLLLQERLETLLSQAADWARLSAVLDEIALLSCAAAAAHLEERVSRARLTSALVESLSALRVPQGRFLKSGVNLLSPAAARGLRFSLVIIPGLDEGKFPARLRQDPLLLDVERSSIGGSRLSLKSQRLDEEKLLFDMAARSAVRRLVVMTSRLDESSDRERIPSEFFLRAAAAARGSPVGLSDLAPDKIPCLRSVSLDNPAPANGQIAVDKYEIRLRLLTSSPGSARVALSALMEEEPELIRRPLSFDEARWLRGLTAFDGRLHDGKLVRAAAAMVGPSAGAVSASRLEDYARCPYLFFLKRVIGLEVWEEETAPEALDPLERGRTIHSILERFLGTFNGVMLASTPVDALRQSLARSAHASLEAARPAGIPDLLWEVERENLEAMLSNWLDFEIGRLGQGYLPAFLEQAFGRFSAEDRVPGLRLQAGRHLFEFRGRIDRVDLSRDGLRARVIDYKTGSLPKTMARDKRPLLMAGEKMQVALYRGALSVLDGFKQVESVEGEYLHLQPKDGDVLDCSFSDDALERAYDRLPAILEIMGDGLENGVFFARTSGTVMAEGHCKFCDYLPVCGKDRMQRERRKADDPEVQRFLKILEIDSVAEDGE